MVIIFTALQTGYGSPFRMRSTSRMPYEGGTKAMSPRETCVKRGSRNALGYDGGANGTRVMEPTGFLRDYWLGRYHGIIEAPSTAEKNLILVKRRENEEFGTKSYDGQGRPKIN